MRFPGRVGRLLKIELSLIFIGLIQTSHVNFKLTLRPASFKLNYYIMVKIRLPFYWYKEQKQVMINDFNFDGLTQHSVILL